MVSPPPIVGVPRLEDASAVWSSPGHVLGDLDGTLRLSAAASTLTTVRFGWTDDGFVAAFDAPAEPPLVVERGAGGEVFRDECVEVFLAGLDAPAVYQEIVVNPAGALYGARVTNPDDSRTTWRLEAGEGLSGVAAEVSGSPGAAPAAWTRWRCRILVPWSSIPGGRPPDAGETRRGNAYRIARGRTTRFLALAPTHRAAPPDFHVPSRFARLVFGGS